MNAQPQRLTTLAPARQVLADLVVIAVFAVAIATSRGFAPVATWFPLAIGVAGMLAGAGKLAVDLRALRRARRTGETSVDAAGGPAQPAEDAADLTAPPMTPEGRRELLIWVGLIGALLALIALIGMVPAAAVWLPAVLWWRGRRSVLLALGGAVAVVIVLVLLDLELAVRWPEPVLDLYGMLDIDRMLG